LPTNRNDPNDPNDPNDWINFAGLFSGTALAAPRSFAIRLRAAF
jgi:hypothetical protein